MTRRRLLALLGLSLLAGCAERGSGSGGEDGGDPGGQGGGDPGGQRGASDEEAGPVQQYRYGSDPAQVVDLWLPEQAATRVAVLVHGGFWQAGYDRTLEHEVAADLVAAGWAVWNIDYRGVGPGSGGGWPGTFTDVAAAVDLYAEAAREHDLPLDRTAFVGHSAGGHLALWAAARGRLPEGAPGALAGAAPAVPAAAVVSQAGLADLVAADVDHLGGGAAASLLGGRADEVPDRYAAADPSQLLPYGVPLLLITGDEDFVVPVSQSAAFAERARAAGDDVTLEVVPGEDHDVHLQPGSRSWALTKTWLDGVLPR